MLELAADKQRREWLRDGIREQGLDAIAASLPENVLLVTGYFPVIGTSLALMSREGEIVLVVPEDERDLAGQGAADQVITYHPASLEKITTAGEAIRGPLGGALRERRLARARIGLEAGGTFEPASYPSMHLFGDSLQDLFESARLRPTGDFFGRMKATLTPGEIERVGRSCRIAAIAFERGREALQPGVKETEAASAFREPLFTGGVGFEGACRADGAVFCMAGAHSSEASRAYARSRPAKLQPSDLVLTHCNSHADGYWTDITRTYCLGAPNERQGRIYEAVFEARRAAMDAVRPGANARDVDRAARDVLRARGFGEQFKHATGHGVGFSAVNHGAMPRIHPESPDVLATGMVFNIEPAVYFEGAAGIRHCDMVAVGADGAEILTPFHARLEDLIR